MGATVYEGHDMTSEVGLCMAEVKMYMPTFEVVCTGCTGRDTV